MLLIGELMRLAEYYMRDGVHVRSIVEGVFQSAKSLGVKKATLGVIKALI